MASLETFISLAKPKIDGKANDLQKLSLKIWEKPELCYEEHFAHGVLSDYFEEQGFDVTRHYTLPTAFRAVYGKETAGPTVAVLWVGAALGIKAAIEGGLKARVVAMGTPAEEGGGGKIQMINSGCFKDVDFCIMVHPAPFNVPFYVSQALEKVEVVYKGYAAHAAASPWEGRNALDAAVIADGGLKPNIIPEQSKLEFWVRTIKNNECAILKSKVHSCFEAAVKATDCTVDIKWDPIPHARMLTNSKLALLYQKYAEHMGVVFPSREEQESIVDGSTDMGNVSMLVPGLHSLYCIDSSVPYHSHAFRVASGTQHAHDQTIVAAKALCFTAIEVLNDPTVLAQVKEEFLKAVQDA
ncbi:hypothetical protein OS493_014287 [Desmophyllum pertusum]|uniref:Peptidase M20 domain-containing protein 2 n=1 Tax=Desmophyllum pertusum TaxID=174260 RepID=A0A9X0CTR6_9CNID|nr:hypothetical protein OS493_014287 [Desmophyllum pertusum]